jgi:hypothetical protein
MKQLLNYSPVFIPGTANNGILDFTTYTPGFQFGKLYAVINVTRNIPLYIPGLAIYGAQSNPNNREQVILSANTATYSSSDTINVYYDTSSGFSTTAYETNQPVELGGQNQNSQEKLDQILVELRLISEVLLQGFGGNLLTVESTTSLRNDITQISGNIDNIGSSQ